MPSTVRAILWSRWKSHTVLVVILLTLTALWGCDGFYPSQAKVGTPDDHTDAKGRGAMHKNDSKNPFTEKGGCSTSDCHQADLRGGLAEVDGRPAEAPSCYQCHDENWDDEEEDDDDAADISTLLVSHVMERL